MPSPAKTTPFELMETLRARLIDKVDELFPQYVWYDDQVLPLGKDTPMYEHAAILVWDGGRFDDAVVGGGGICSIRQQGAITVSIMKRMGSDEGKKLDQILAYGDSPMFELMQKVMRALTVEGTQRWEPTNAGGEVLFGERLKPLAIESPKRHQEWAQLYFYISFGFSFDWDL